MPRGWFGPNLTGYGVGPRSWQGWLATAILAGVAIGTRFVPPQSFGLSHGWRAVLIGGALLGYLTLVYATYDSEV